MSSTRKRGRQEMEDHPQPESKQEPTLLQRIRNMWEFANLAQYIYMFGKAVKIDEDFGIEELEMECMTPNSPVLSSIGLALLKFVSSHRGLTPEIFDEYTRRQYVAKAPERNPFGVEEAPVSFSEFDIFTKIRVLQQLTQWTMGNPDRIRERMVDDQKDEKQTLWRIEPFGWDSKDRTYIVLDDDRLYRRTEPPPPPPPAPKPKKNSRKAKANSRASKRRKISEPVEDNQEDVEDVAHVSEEVVEDDGLGGVKWECLAVGLGELNEFLATIEKTRDPNEKTLRKRLTEDLLPLLAKREEARQRKEAQKQRELVNLEKLATAKRSSRIAGKMEQQKQEEDAREAERRKQAELSMAKKEQQKWEKMEKERDSRMQTREQRLREREARRILHEEELSQLSEDSKKVESGESRISERFLKAEIERKKKALEEINAEDKWIFDCLNCGAYGEQFDDGTHSISCEECNIWQHSKCVGVSQEEAERDDFHFVCSTCKRRAEDAEKSKLHPIKLKLGRPSSSSSSSGPLIPQANGAISNMPNQPSNGTHVSPHLSSQVLPVSKVISPYGNGNGQHEQLASQPARNDFAAAVGSTSGPANMPASHVWVSNEPIRNSGLTSGIEAPSTRHVSTGGTNLLSSPMPHSPTSLPPPAQPRMYNYVNGHPSQPYPTNGTLSNTQSAPPKAPYQSNPQTSTIGPGSPYYFKPQNVQQNGNRPSERRLSTSFPSPLAGAPILTPKQYTNNTPSTPGFPQYNTSIESHSHARLPPSSPSKRSSPSYAQSFHVSDHATTLPPPTTGFSPTKHSPPRPHLSKEATPSSLPPVAPLLPSSPVQNLSPPVKAADPEHARQSSANSSFDH